VASDKHGLLSIGALSAATGIPVETIRTWERRYGFPVAKRKRSGHRVYPLDTVVRLRLIAEALARGYRPAEVVGVSQGTLEAMLAALPPAAKFSARMVHPEKSAALANRVLATPDLTATYFEAIRAFDVEGLRRLLHREWARLGPTTFLDSHIGPLLAEIGEAWAEGTLDVRHEHFAVAVLGDFLREVRLPFEDRSDGPIIALATLADELHGLGLEMCALVAAVVGWRPLVLGVNTPRTQIVALAREVSVAAMAISCAPPRRARTATELRSLRRQLPREVALVVGGGGAPSLATRSGIQVLRDLASLERWLRERSP
jgi:DNA-binding transcriptional MerR regulator/methylmalonyl-CoA mutase cobalamin-binding subunit